MEKELLTLPEFILVFMWVCVAKSLATSKVGVKHQSINQPKKKSQLCFIDSN
jgi:hypothetical protein